MPFYLINSISWNLINNPSTKLPISIGISLSKDDADFIYDILYDRFGYKVITANISRL
jgi:hypothetical protein